jgi:hypothetical protein
LARCLNDEAGVEFVLTPLDEAVQILFDNHGIPGLIRIDRDRVDANLPVTSWVTDLDLLSTLAVVAKQHDLDVDYRYGCLWFTSTEIPEWTDPTGVAAIQPTAGTPLAAIWNEPVSVDTSGIPPHTQPLARVLGAIAEPLGIDIDVTKIEPPLDDPDRYSRMCILRKHPFHQTLGILLYETGCRCRLEGGRLVVLPPENPSTDRG